MFVDNAEFIARERQKDLLLQAERNRLIKTVRQQPTNERHEARSVTTWLGVRLVTWGLKLQGQPAPITTVTVSNGECSCP